MPIAWDDFDTRTTIVRCDGCFRRIETKDFLESLMRTKNGRNMWLLNQWQFRWRGRKFAVMEFGENSHESHSALVSKVPLWMRVRLWLEGVR
jgi:hypothetical protein